jgi:hypothetical protein
VSNLVSFAFHYQSNKPEGFSYEIAGHSEEDTNDLLTSVKTEWTQFNHLAPSEIKYMIKTLKADMDNETDPLKQNSITIYLMILASALFHRKAIRQNKFNGIFLKKMVEPEFKPIDIWINA